MAPCGGLRAHAVPVCVSRAVRVGWHGAWAAAGAADVAAVDGPHVAALCRAGARGREPFAVANEHPRRQRPDGLGVDQICVQLRCLALPIRDLLSRNHRLALPMKASSSSRNGTSPTGAPPMPNIFRWTTGKPGSLSAKLWRAMPWQCDRASSQCCLHGASCRSQATWMRSSCAGFRASLITTKPEGPGGRVSAAPPGRVAGTGSGTHRSRRRTEPAPPACRGRTPAR